MYINMVYIYTFKIHIKSYTTFEFDLSFSKVDVCLIVCLSKFATPHLSFYEFFELLIIKFTISIFIKPLQYSVNLKQRSLVKNLMDWAYLPVIL